MLEVNRDPTLAADKQLMEEVARGSQRARRVLMMRLWRRVKNTARYISFTDDETDDLVQEVMIKILDSAGKYNATGSVEAWADVITVRVSLRLLKRIRRYQKRFANELGDEGSLERNPEREVYVRALRARVAQLMTRLTTKQQLSLMLKLAYGYTVEEVAEMLGETINVVRYQLQTGRAKLRRLVMKDAALAAYVSGIES